VVIQVQAHQGGPPFERVSAQAMPRLSESASGAQSFNRAATGGGIRHGTNRNAGVATMPHETRLFCNLIRSYIAFLTAEHERLTGSSNVLDS
jgi:hypothetical protein